MPDYSKGKVYCLRSYQTDDIYIGSTIQTLSVRIGGHKRDYNCWKNGKYHYVTSFELIKYDDCYIELLEDFPCENKNQLEKREGFHQRSMDCVNKFIAGRSDKEWREDNKNKIKEDKKLYRLEHIEKNKEYQTEYRICNREKAKQYKKKYYLKKKAEKELIKHLEIISLL